MNEIICDYSIPVDLGNATSGPDFEFSRLNCTSSIFLIREASTTPIIGQETEFYISPVLNYADVIFIFFLITFLGFKIFDAVWNFVHLLIIRWKRL